ncbi:MAG: pilus assembly protein [Steroidobacteraceae bacterium]
MKTSKLHYSATVAAITLLIGSPALADDTEIFFGTSTSGSPGAPNIMLILDTSGSMDTNVTTTTTYNPAGSYSGNCSSSKVYFKSSGSKVYFKSSGSTLPQCASDGTVSNDSYRKDRYYGTLSATDFYCSPATSVGGSFSTAGYYQGNAIRWTRTGISSNSGSTWTYSYAWQGDLYPQPDTSGSSRTSYVTTTIACEDHNYSGSYPNGVNPNSGGTGTPWVATNGNSYWAQNSARTSYVFYSAHYLNWYYNYRTTTTSTRLQIVKDAASNLLDSLSGVNVGLMRYDSNGNGGMVVAPVQDVTTGRAAMKNTLNSWYASGNTPLSETLSEAHRYFKGSAVSYGNNSYECVANGFGGCNNTLSKSVPSSRTGGTITDTNYDSPADYSCQKNYTVFLTDGEPNGDDGANTYINGLSSTDAACSGNGGCLSTLTSYMYNNDLRADVSDTQNVTTFFIGFGSEVSGGAPFTYLDNAAVAGGGHAYAATDLDTLTNTLNDIFLTIRNDSSTFASPSVAVNAFNKTQVLEDLYISVFQPTLKTHWPGNLKKYKLRNSKIVGQDTTTSAVNTSTGFFETFAQSYWSTAVDGKTTTAGGAANMIPAPASRNVYTYIGSNPAVGSFPDLSSSVNYSVDDSNTNITDTLLNIGGTGDPAKATLLNWARGQDTNDDNNNGSTTDARHVMGDPIHAQPAVVIYGNTGSTFTAQINDAVTYIATNDGYLHAIDVSNGQELWSFIPQELLGQLATLYTNPAIASPDNKHYSLDGNLRVLKYDVDGDGVVDIADGDRVFLYFSQGRGGDHYYALDVTNKTHPKYMWTLGSSALGGIVNQSWSTPALGRVKISGATQNPQKLVLIFGAGNDPAEDNQAYNSVNAYGNGIFMVDAVRGTVLWSQTKTSNGSAFDKMTHAIPSNVAVLDTNSDGWTDRLYVGDLAGQLWRFDITNGNTAANLVAGGVIASLGHQSGDTGNASNRSFYNEPDISKFVVAAGANYYNIAIGSGDRAHPKLNTTTQDRFYAIRDYMLSPMTQSAYNNYTPIVDSDLTQVDGTTASTIGVHGWKLPLSSAEKALAQSVTVNGIVMFTTYIPFAAASSCSPSTGGGRAYSVNAGTGIKYFTNLYETFATTGLPSQVSIVNEGDIVRTDGTTASSSSSTSSGSSSSSSSTPPPTGTCLSGVSILGNCVEFGSRVKTFWTEPGAN